jgi:small subunit ribosomal protein S16
LLRIRLARTGAKKKPSYRVVVIDRERARDGRFVEILGHYNPRRNPPELVLNQERTSYWLGRGAQPSETVQSFLKKPPEVKAEGVGSPA